MQSLETKKRMVRLAYVAYSGSSYRKPRKVAKAVRKGLSRYADDQTIVWGPALDEPLPLLPNDAMAFIVEGNGEYTVVIRGTNL